MGTESVLPGSEVHFSWCKAKALPVVSSTASLLIQHSGKSALLGLPGVVVLHIQDLRILGGVRGWEFESLASSPGGFPVISEV